MIRSLVSIVVLFVLLGIFERNDLTSVSSITFALFLSNMISMWQVSTGLIGILVCALSSLFIILLFILLCLIAEMIIQGVEWMYNRIKERRR